MCLVMVGIREGGRGLQRSLKEGHIRIWLLMAVVVLTFGDGAVATSASLRDARSAPGELIIKLRTPSVRTGQEPASAAAHPDDLPGLRGLRSRCRVHQVRPLMNDRQRRQMAELQATHRRRGETSLLRRQERIPGDERLPDLQHVYRVRVDAGSPEELNAVLAACRQDPDIEYAELNPVIRICAQPTDPSYASQWNLAKVAAPQAWETCRGDGEVVIAVIDTGLDYTHRDIQGNLWFSTAEVNGAAGVDDDNNGYVDDIHGYNFTGNNGDPLDDHGHGTHCAGIIAAVGNNNLDVTGLCWSGRIMPLKILDAEGDGTAADAAPAVYYAVANGADVISCSWGGQDESQLLKDALLYAHRQGVVIVAAAGNEGSNVPFYPAAYPEVIGVAATDSGDRRWLLSNYGDWVSLAAPGRDILSLHAAGAAPDRSQDGFTAKLSGTSMAAPHVAGTCALLLSANPLLTPAEVAQIVTSTVDPIAEGICASNGRLNVARAMRATVPPLGTVRLDRAVYGQGAEVGVLLADWHLQGMTGASVMVETDGGDAEQVTLVETAVARGVFKAAIPSEGGPPRPGDGRIQMGHAERIIVRYTDADDGAGHSGQQVEAVAVADFEPPALLQRTADIRGAVARFELATSEPTRAEVLYTPVVGGPYSLSEKDIELSMQHSIRLAGLSVGVRYYVLISLVDEAGNQAILGGDGTEYSFVAGGEFAGYRVPGVYPTIQAAIDDAWHGDTIWVADGTYSGPGNIEIDFHGKAVTVRSESGPETCIIDCLGQGRAFHFHNGEDQDAVVDGFTITNGGNADEGAGVLCVASGPVIRNCIFTNNSAREYGGGLCNSSASSPTVSGCTFKGNSCSTSGLFGRGGGMANRHGSNPIVTDCVFIENSATYGAGGMGNSEGSSPHVTRCIFKSNSALYYGGAVGNWDDSRPVFRECVFSGNVAHLEGGAMSGHVGSGASLENCVFSGNAADGLGGAVKNHGAALTLRNCTIHGNRSSTACGGVWSGGDSRLVMDSCILWANTDPDGWTRAELAQLAVDAGDVTIDYCCVEGWSGSLGGLGNFGLDPLLIDPQGEDFRLQSEGWRWDRVQGVWGRDAVTSPCIDAGNPARPLGKEPLAVPNDPNDVATENKRIDMGAYGGTPEASLAPKGRVLLADLDNDGRVGWPDLDHMAATWLDSAGTRAPDLTRDGTVGLADLAAMAREWRGHTGP